MGRDAAATHPALAHDRHVDLACRLGTHAPAGGRAVTREDRSFAARVHRCDRTPGRLGFGTPPDEHSAVQRVEDAPLDPQCDLPIGQTEKPQLHRGHDLALPIGNRRDEPIDVHN